MCKIKLESIYTPLVAKEYLSLLCHRGGVPSVDMFAETIISSFRTRDSPNVPDTLRRVITLGKWSNMNTVIVAWTIEPAIATMSVMTPTPSSSGDATNPVVLEILSSAMSCPRG
jgi:hypothetical protein